MYRPSASGFSYAKICAMATSFTPTHPTQKFKNVLLVPSFAHQPHTSISRILQLIDRFYKRTNNLQICGQIKKTEVQQIANSPVRNPLQNLTIKKLQDHFSAGVHRGLQNRANHHGGVNCDHVQVMLLRKVPRCLLCECLWQNIPSLQSPNFLCKWKKATLRCRLHYLLYSKLQGKGSHSCERNIFVLISGNV